MKKIIFIISALCLSQSILQAQGQFKLKEINTAWFPAVGFGSTPAEKTEFNGRIYFSAQESAIGRTLWSTDGSTAGTKKYSATHINPTELTAINNYLYFSAEDASGDRELYRTDGVTSPIKIEVNTSGNTNPAFVSYDQGRIYFRGVTTSNGTQVCSFPENNPSSIALHLPASGGTPFNAYTISGGQLIMIRRVNSSDYNLYTLTTGSPTAVPLNHGLIPGNGFNPGIVNTDLVAYNGKAYVGTIFDLFELDATGVTLISSNIRPKTLVVANNELFFQASPPGNVNLSYLHRLDNTGVITGFPSIPLVGSSSNSLFIFNNLMYGWIEDGASNGIYKFHFSTPTPTFSANLPSKPENFDTAYGDYDTWYHVAYLPGTIGSSVLKTNYLGTTVLCSNNIDYVQNDFILFNNDLYFNDFFWDTGVPNPIVDCDPPQANTGVEIFKLTQSQLNCQPVTIYNSGTLTDGFYTSGTTLDIGGNMTFSGNTCTILQSPSTTINPVITITPPAQVLTIPGGCP